MLTRLRPATPCAAAPDALLPLEQLLGRYLAKYARRVADDDDPRRHVLRHDRSRADERLLADLDAGTEHRPAADPCATAYRRALDQLAPTLRSTHEIVVRRHDAGGDEDVLLER